MKTNKFLLIIFLCSIELLSFAQVSKEIYEIQGTSSTSPFVSQVVTTTGIVTATYMENNQLGGFFMQSKNGGISGASCGIFVYLGSSSYTVAKGDEVEVTGTVSEYNQRTQISNITNCTVKSHGNVITPTKVVFDENFKANAERYECMLLQFDQTLTVVSNRNLRQYGQLTLSSKRLKTPTEITLPGSAEFYALRTANYNDQIILDDASTVVYPQPIPFVDANGTRRTGERIDNFIAILDQIAIGYVVYAAENMTFYGNPRPVQPTNLGNYNLKVCSFNLKYYLRENFGTGYGPNNQTEADRQHSKILKALLAIDADIYGLVEIQTGQNTIEYLTNALNASVGNDVYAYINDGTTTYGSYTKVGFIYRKDKVATVKELRSNNDGIQNRKKAQCFKLLSNNEAFVFSLNHFKAKSGCSSATGDNVDIGDGQSCYNGDRVREANSTISFVNVCATYYNEPDILIMGDLNAYTKEDPLQVFYNYNYTNLQKHFQSESEYSYSYNSEVGCLDHALGNPSLTQQVSGCAVFHINADEPSYFEYDQTPFYDTMYRCSDHDAVVVGLNLGVQNTKTTFESNLTIAPNPTKGTFTIANACGSRLTITDLLGRFYYTTILTTDNETINTTLPQGVYLLNFTLGSKTTTKKIIIQ